MNNLIISKKGSMPKFYLVSGVFEILLAIVLFCSMRGTSVMDDETMDIIFTIAPPIIFATIGAFMIGCSARYSKAYINVYDDHIEGFGVQGKNGNMGQNFYMKNSEPYMVNTDGDFCIINVNGKGFYIYLPNGGAAEVYGIINQVKSGAMSYQPAQVNPGMQMNYSQATNQNGGMRVVSNEQAAQKTLLFPCPNCRNKYHIPAVRGPVRIGCPHCGHVFEGRVE